MRTVQLEQLSTRFRRGIVAALDPETAVALASWGVGESAYVDFISIDDVLSDDLEEVGIWDALNDACGTHITTYDEEVIQIGQLETAIEVVETFWSATKWQDNRLFLRRLRTLLVDAAKREMPVFLIL